MNHWLVAARSNKLVSCNFARRQFLYIHSSTYLSLFLLNCCILVCSSYGVMKTITRCESTDEDEPITSALDGGMSSIESTSGWRWSSVAPAYRAYCFKLLSRGSWARHIGRVRRSPRRVSCGRHGEATRAISWWCWWRRRRLGVWNQFR